MLEIKKKIIIKKEKRGNLKRKKEKIVREK